MKQLVLSIALAVAVSIGHSQSSTWVHVPKPEGALDIQGLCHADSLKVYGCGGGAKIIKSTDGGRSWFLLPTPIGAGVATFYGVYASHDSVWVVGDPGYGSGPGKMFRSTNGGQNWITMINPHPDNLLRDIARVGGELWAIGVAGSAIYKALLLRSSNGGVNWQATEYPQFTGFRRLWVINPNNVWVIGTLVTSPVTLPLLAQTTNQGSDWINRTPNWNKQLQDVVFDDNGNLGWLVAQGDSASYDGATLFASTNAGQTWTQRAALSPSQLTEAGGIAIISGGSEIHIAGGLTQTGESGAIIIRSLDSGYTWTRVALAGWPYQWAGISRYDDRHMVSAGAELFYFVPGNPPGPVSLLSPPNRAIDQPVLLTLRWLRDENVSWYRLQLAVDSVFSNPAIVLDDSLLTDTLRLVGPLANSTRYYWRVRGKNYLGIGPWSEVFSFTTIMALPSQVELLAPEHGAIVGADSVLCRWRQAEPAVTKYWFERATDSLFTIARQVDSTLTDTSTVTRGLLNNRTYWWRVRARNPVGWGQFSNPRRFLAVFATPGPVALVSPPNGAINQPLSLTLRWLRDESVSSYRLQLATDSVFSNPAIVLDDSLLTDTLRLVGPLTNDTRYYWRVRGKNYLGIGPWSEVFSFTTIVTLPTQVSLIYPEHGGTIGADSVICLWRQAEPAITNYWFERAADSLFVLRNIIDSTLTDTSRIIRGLVSNESYWHWWRVRAKNAAGWGPWSQSRRFRAVFTSVAGEDELPTRFALEQNYPNPFNPSTTIRYSLPVSAEVTLTVYNLLGQEVAVLVNERQPPGNYRVVCDASPFTSGIYFYRLQAGSFSATRKLVVVR